MKTEERFERIESNIERLPQVTATIAESVVARDDQIDKLIAALEIQRQRWDQLQREWQAYLTTIQPRQ